MAASMSPTTCCGQMLTSGEGYACTIGLRFELQPKWIRHGWVDNSAGARHQPRPEVTMEVKAEMTTLDESQLLIVIQP